jgi:hypothetical protein
MKRVCLTIKSRNLQALAELPAGEAMRKCPFGRFLPGLSMVVFGLSLVAQAHGLWRGRDRPRPHT